MFKSASILIVDDEVLICSNLKKGLQLYSEKYRIFTAHCCAEALEIIKNNTVDVMISDILLPGPDGIEVMVEGRKINHELQTIIITGHGNISNAVNALRNGASNYIQKPVAFEVLNDSIQSCLQKLFITRQLKDSEERYRQLADSAVIGIATVDGNMQFTYANQALSTMLDYTNGDLIGNQLNLIIHQRQLDKFNLRSSSALTATRKKLVLESEITTRKEKKLWTMIHVTPQYTPDGHFNGYSLVFTDISGRKRAEDDLNENLKFMDAIVNNITDAIITTDDAGQILFWNPSAERIFGYEKEEILNKNLTKLIPVRYHSAHLHGMSKLRKTLDSNAIGRPINTIGLTRDNAEINIQLTIAVSKTNDTLYFNSVIRELVNKDQNERSKVAEYSQ